MIKFPLMINFGLEAVIWSLCALFVEIVMKQQIMFFFSCAYASRIWLWLSNCLGFQIDHSSVHSVLAILHRNWCSQVKEVILSTICYSL